jgi:hypothetical protein
MKYALVLLAGCWSQAAPAPAPPVQHAPAGPPVLDQPPWPTGDELVIEWHVARVNGEASVDFRIGTVRRSFDLGKPGAPRAPERL